MKSHVTKGKEAIDRALDLIEQLDDFMKTFDTF